MTQFPHLYNMKVKVTQSCPTLFDTMDYAVHGILQARILEWVAIPFSRGSPQSRDQTQVSQIADGIFTSWATREGPPCPPPFLWSILNIIVLFIYLFIYLIIFCLLLNCKHHEIRDLILFSADLKCKDAAWYIGNTEQIFIQCICGLREIGFPGSSVVKR